MQTPSPGRDAVSNGKRLLPRSAGIDMRSSDGRRFRHLVAAYSAECGRELSELELSHIRQAAAVQLKVERLQASIVRGDDVDSDEVIRLSSEHRRLLSGLKDRAAQNKPAGPTNLHELLAGVDDA